jgi:hypothetical protein
VTPTPGPTETPSQEPTPVPTLPPSHLPTYSPTFRPTSAPSGNNFGYADDSPLPMCINMCENAFANVTDEFEWVSAGVLNELRAIIMTLEAEFDMVALDRHFELVNNAAAKVLAPLEERSKQLAKTHSEYLEKLQNLVESRNARLLDSAELASTSNTIEESAQEAWQDASEPLRIELTTIGTTIAFLVGMLIANFAHGRKGIRSQSNRHPTTERSRIARAAAGQSKYGAFE